MYHNKKELKEYMEKNINIATEELRQQLVQSMNNSGLPISTIYLIINELQWKTEKAYYAELNASVQKEIEKETEGESE
jgi:uncharacterized protein with ParB-like and HNH nuclease domain